jgi:hypothetical protein
MVASRLALTEKGAILDAGDMISLPDIANGVILPLSARIIPPGAVPLRFFISARKSSGLVATLAKAGTFFISFIAGCEATADTNPVFGIGRSLGSDSFTPATFGITAAAVGEAPTGGIPPIAFIFPVPGIGGIFGSKLLDGFGVTAFFIGLKPTFANLGIIKVIIV